MSDEREAVVFEELLRGARLAAIQLADVFEYLDIWASGSSLNGTWSASPPCTTHSTIRHECLATAAIRRMR